jgi:signal transduction histidine kinase
MILSDRALVTAFSVCILLIGYQFTVTLLQPSWIKPVTDWLRTALAWPQLAVEAWVAVRLHQLQRRDAVTGYFITLGMLFYALARTTFTIADVVIYPHGVPYPSLADIFFILQYPCFIAALFLYDPGGRWLPNVRVIVDAVLWMSAVTALSWYFVLLPLSLQTHEPPLGKSISILHQVADLVLFYGLVVALTRPFRTTSERLVVSLMSLAILSLFIADTWAAVLLLHPPYTYRTGSMPDLFWFICYLLLPLAALVRLRLIPAGLPSRPRLPSEPLSWRDTLASVRFVAPSVAVVAAGVVIIVHATATSPSPAGPRAPVAVGIVLLLLATLRPAVMYLEEQQLRQERDAARDQERALRISNERMEAFLSMVAHELRTPLTSLIGNVHLMTRRLDALLRLVRNHEDCTDAARVLRALIDWCDHSLQRMRRLVEDVEDGTRVQRGRLDLRLEQRNMASLVSDAVMEQAALNPERTIRLVAEGFLVPVVADGGRIEQVVTNYVSNALKFSPDDQSVEVCLRTEDGMARVTVHDEGGGIPLADQPHLWERFYQAKGVDVKSGSQVGFGIGLYLSKAIVEAHHGQVGVESAPGEGTTFWFALPLAPPLASASPKAGADGSSAPPQAGGHECGHDL